MTELEQIRKILEDNPQFFAVKIKANKALRKFIFDETSWLDEINPLLKTRIYCVLNGVKTWPTCQTCGKEIKTDIHKINVGFPQYCSSGCVSKNAGIKQRKENTMLEHYGVKNPSECASIQAKKKQTSIERYGVSSPTQAVGIKEKIRNTLMERYGAACSFQVKDIKEKAIQSLRERYGVDNAFASKEVQKRIRKTNRERYGCDYPCQCKEIQDKLHPTYNYHGIIFQSGPELAFYIWLTDHNIEFEYHPKSKAMQYMDDTGKSHRYFPDFWLTISDKVIEIKGDNHFENNDPNGKMICINDRSKDYVAEAKHQCMLKNNVVIMTKVDYGKFEQYVRAKYGKDYLKCFKCK